mmetsp:Transcript_47613/g.42701  ORF Transcript_47613/g.42701 Transcript_47613/m.42701 type:complete len:178 (-) Transcript_47613:41-574(-)
MFTISVLIICIQISLISSALYTDTGYCLAEGFLAGNINAHSTESGEHNLFWCNQNKKGCQDSRAGCDGSYDCPCLDIKFSSGKLYYGSYHLEWDLHQGSGNEIMDDERNLKADPNVSGDTFYTYSGSWCTTDNNDNRCCMEWDSDTEYFYTYNDYIRFDGREAKLDCDGGKDNVQFV